MGPTSLASEACSLGSWTSELLDLTRSYVQPLCGFNPWPPSASSPVSSHRQPAFSLSSAWPHWFPLDLIPCLWAFSFRDLSSLPGAPHPSRSSSPVTTHPATL